MRANPRPIRKAERERVAKASQARRLHEALTALAKVQNKYLGLEALVPLWQTLDEIHHKARHEQPTTNPSGTEKP
jgi:hypothetical protein